MAARQNASRLHPSLPYSRLGEGGGEIDGDDGVARLAFGGVVLAHADPAPAARIDHAIGEPPIAPGRGRRRSQGLRLGRARGLPVQAAIGEIGEIDRSVPDQP